MLDFCVTRHNLLYDNLNNGIIDIGKASILQQKKNQISTIISCPGSQAHPRAPKTVDSHDVWVMVTQNPKRMTQFMGATGQTCCPGIYLTRISGPHRPLFLEDGGWLLVITPFFVGFASLSLTNNLNLNIHLFETNTFLCVETNMHFCGDEHSLVCGDEHQPVRDEHPSVYGDEHPPVGDEHPPVVDEHPHVCGGDEHQPVGDEHPHVC